VVRIKVEEALRNLMNLNIRLSKKDWRVKAIASEIKGLYDEEKRNSCISDEEMKAFVEKYFIFESIYEKEIHHFDEIHPEEIGRKNSK
jgi:hypothetical protein